MGLVGDTYPESFLGTVDLTDLDRGGRSMHVAPLSERRELQAVTVWSRRSLRHQRGQVELVGDLVDGGAVGKELWPVCTRR